MVSICGTVMRLDRSIGDVAQSNSFPHELGNGLVRGFRGLLQCAKLLRRQATGHHHHLAGADLDRHRLLAPLVGIVAVPVQFFG